MKSPNEHHHHHHHHHAMPMRKKRVGKACDSCRLKKTKCNGKNPCERCSIDNKPCVFTEKKRQNDRMFTSEHVDLIEHRLKICNRSLLKLAHWVKDGNRQELDRFAHALKANRGDESLESNEESEYDNDDDNDDNDYGINVNEIITLLQSTTTSDAVRKTRTMSTPSVFKPNEEIKDQIYSPISLSPSSTGFGNSVSPTSLTKVHDSSDYLTSVDDMSLFGMNPIAERDSIDDIFEGEPSDNFLNSSTSSFSYLPLSNTSEAKLLNMI